MPERSHVEILCTKTFPSLLRGEPLQKERIRLCNETCPENFTPKGAPLQTLCEQDLQPVFGGYCRKDYLPIAQSSPKCTTEELVVIDGVLGMGEPWSVIEERINSGELGETMCGGTYETGIKDKPANPLIKY